MLFALAAVQTMLLARDRLRVPPLHESPSTLRRRARRCCVLTAFAAVGMGLLVSASVRSQDQATSFIPLVLIPQLFFGGSIVPIATMSAPLAGLSGLVIARWSYAGLGPRSDLNARIAHSPATRR